MENPLTEAPVPPVPRDVEPGGVRWLRANVARFSAPEDHPRRRALVLDELGAMSSLRDKAFAYARRLGNEPVDVIARTVPVAVLARELGLPDVSRDIATVSACYHPHVEPSEAAGRAMSRLIAACGGAADERTAARIGLLVQACVATAGLIDKAAVAHGDDVGEILDAVLRDDPPVRTTRRFVNGEIVEVELTKHPFGAGPKACPGQTQALELAAGVLSALAAGGMC